MAAANTSGIRSLERLYPDFAAIPITTGIRTAAVPVLESTPLIAPTMTMIAMISIRSVFANLVTIPPLLSTVFFPDMLIRFHKKYPDIPVELYEYGSIRAAELVQDETLDLALVNMNFYGLDKLNSFKILSDRIVFCVSGDHPLAEEKEVTMDMLQEESVILYNTDSVQNSTLNALFDQLEKKPNVILRASQLYTIRNFVQQNLGGAFLYASLLRNMPELIGLPIVPTIEQEIGLIWKKGKYVNSSVEKFLSFAEELLR